MGLNIFKKYCLPVCLYVCSSSTEKLLHQIGCDFHYCFPKGLILKQLCVYSVPQLEGICFILFLASKIHESK